MSLASAFCFLLGSVLSCAAVASPRSCASAGCSGHTGSSTTFPRYSYVSNTGSIACSTPKSAVHPAPIIVPISLGSLSLTPGSSPPRSFTRVGLGIASESTRPWAFWLPVAPRLFPSFPPPLLGLRGVPSALTWLLPLNGCVPVPPLFLRAPRTDLLNAPGRKFAGRSSIRLSLPPPLPPPLPPSPPALRVPLPPSLPWRLSPLPLPLRELVVSPPVAPPVRS
jgi:hypothetical protein